MSNVSAKKVFIQIESASEQQVSAALASLILNTTNTQYENISHTTHIGQEHLKNQRKTLKVLQGVATDKENLAGRPQLDKLSRLKAATDATLATTEYAKRKKTDTRAVETQTSPDKKVDANEITVEDLTSDAKPSESYWECLAEKRREALEETLAENQHLHERIAGLEEELNTSRQMLEETRNLVEVLTEMLNENEADDKSESDGVELLAIEEDKNREETTCNKDSETDSKN